jgi:hypothetical protein
MGGCIVSTKILSIIAALLAYTAAALAYFRADPGENVTFAVVVPVVMGTLLLWMGWRTKEKQRT